MKKFEIIIKDAEGRPFEQGSETWKRLRAGKITGSEVYKLMGKKGIAQTGISYLKKIVAEGKTLFFNEIETPAMRWGKENEPVAREKWILETGECLEQVPFIIPNDNKNYGFSPDGINFDKEYFIEIKCPYTIEGHLTNLLVKSQDELKSEREEYYWQIMFGMYVTGFKKAYYISFDPRWMTDCIYEITVLKNESDINLLESRIFEAIDIMKEIKIKAKI